ncbi:uncharacterized protein LOC123264347 [Cotesia glomerata]|uniref:uncharacterized protein LOC123264347 n=1 Tax=Cotesia glomerata TaxID=32391 RepID=UPI001D01E259|nr:uncharacterized protein LOC123264347 [Cotesia glomerata]
MECSPRRSRSLTFDVPSLLGSSYPPALNFVATENSAIKNSLLTLGAKCIQSGTNLPPHACSMDDNTEYSKKEPASSGENKINVAPSCSRSKKAILDGMMDVFGSVKSFVRKLPNVVSNLNEEFSVTVVSNGDNILSRDLYVSVPLSSKENIQINMDMDTSIKIDEELSRNSETFKPSRFLSEIFSKPRSNLPHRKFLSADNIHRQTWSEHTKYAEELFVDVAFEAACEESIGNSLFSGNAPVGNNNKKILATQSESMEIDREDFDLLDLSCPNSVPETKDIEMIQKESLEISKSMIENKNSIECKFTSRTREISESSDGSGNSFIVFEKSQDSEYCSTSGDDEDDNDDDDDDDSKDSDEDSYNKFTVEFTSKSDFRSRRYSESSDDSDSCVDDTDFIMFKDVSPSKCPVEYSALDDSPGEKRESKVRFDPKPLIHTMIKWNYAYRAARKGPWEEIARDRERFRNKINSIGCVINPILTAEHRQNIRQIRFDFQD